MTLNGHCMPLNVPFSNHSFCIALVEVCGGEKHGCVLPALAMDCAVPVA